MKTENKGPGFNPVTSYRNNQTIHLWMWRLPLWKEEPGILEILQIIQPAMLSESLLHTQED